MKQGKGVQVEEFQRAIFFFSLCQTPDDMLSGDLSEPETPSLGRKECVLAPTFLRIILRDVI